MTIKGAGTGYAGIECIDFNQIDSGVNGFALVHKVSIFDCDTMVLVRCTNLSTPTEFYGEYVDINGYYTYGVKVESSSSDADFGAFVNLENYYCSPSYDSAISNHVSGLGSELVVQGSSLVGLKQLDKAFYIEDGSKLSLYSTDIMSFNIGIHVGTSSLTGDLGIFSQFECVGTMINDSTGGGYIPGLDILIDHPSTVGVFQGIPIFGNYFLL